MLDQANPYDQFDEQPVAPTVTPRLPAQGPGPGHVAIPPQAATQAPPQAANPYDQFGQPVQQQPGDHSLTTDDAMEGGFADSHPATPKSKLSPEDEAQYRGLLHTADASTLQRFLVSKGYAADPSQLELFVKQREQAKAKGGRVNYGVSYDFPRPVLQHDPGSHGPAWLDAGVAPVHGFLENVPGFDHAAALGRAIDNKVLGRAGTRTFGQEYNYQDDLQHGQVAYEEENHPYLRVSGELLGGLAIPAGLEGVGLKAGTDVLKAGGSMADARAAVKVAVRNRMSAGGAIYGAAHGAGKADTPGEAITGALTEGALGAATGGAMGQLGRVSKAAADSQPILTDAQRAVATFDRGGVDPLMPYVGGTGSQMAAGVTHMTLGGIPLAAAAQKTVDQAKAFRDRIASGMGWVKDSMGAGRAAQKGADAFVSRSGGKATSLYDAIPIAGERNAVLNGTKQALDDVNAGLSSNEELSKLIEDPRLAAYQRAIKGSTEQMPTGLLDADGNPVMRTVQKGGALSWQDLKAFRTYIGEKLNGLTFQNDTSQNALNHLYAGLSSDMEATARAQGPEALAKFQRANNYYRARQARIQQVIKPILGDKGDGGPQAAFNQIQSWASHKGETIKVAQLMRSLPDDEAGTVRATLFSRLGNANPGAQNALDNAFSPTTFATHWAAMDPRAKAAIFSPEHRKDIDDLVEIAHRMKNSDRYANNSKTALGANAGGHAAAAWTAIASFNPLAMLGTAGVIGTEVSAGHLLASPRFARWMVGMAKKPNPAARLAQIQRLTTVARSEPPAIANQIFHLQQRLAAAFTGGADLSPARLAASPSSSEPTDKPLPGNGNAGDQEPQNESLQP